METQNDLLPWHDETWRQILSTRADGRLPHAMLLHGTAGLGKGRFARQLAALCLCERAPAGPGPCGACGGCRLVQAGTHPDLHRIEPEEGKLSLSIDQIRELSADLSLQPHLAALKIAVIEPAEALTLAAANALLKTLEEPPGATLLLLVTARPSALPATIRSRCLGLRFRAPPASEAVRWLASQSDAKAAWPRLLTLAGGAPLRALALAQSGATERVGEFERDLLAISERRADPLEVSSLWAAENKALWWSWLQGRVAALIRQKTLGEKSETGHSNAAVALPNYGSDLKLTALLDYWDTLLRTKPALDALPDEAGTDQERRRIEQLLDSLLLPWMHGLESPGRLES